jgi:hypothetical protein
MRGKNLFFFFTATDFHKVICDLYFLKYQVLKKTLYRG